MERLIYRTRLVLAVIFLLTAGGCKVTFVPNYDSAIAGQMDQAAKLTDKFYLKMLETTKNENEGRSYAKFAEEYVVIEVELNSLLNKNKVRPLNENSVRICEITLELWIKYKEEHKTDNELGD